MKVTRMWRRHSKRVKLTWLGCLLMALGACQSRHSLPASSTASAVIEIEMDGKVSQQHLSGRTSLATLVPRANWGALELRSANGARSSMKSPNQSHANYDFWIDVEANGARLSVERRLTDNMSAATKTRLRAPILVLDSLQRVRVWSSAPQPKRNGPTLAIVTGEASHRANAVDLQKLKRVGRQGVVMPAGRQTNRLRKKLARNHRLVDLVRSKTAVSFREITLHGRGGDVAFTSAQLAQAAPSIRVNRRGLFMVDYTDEKGAHKRVRGLIRITLK